MTTASIRSSLYEAGFRRNGELRPHHGWWTVERFGAVDDDETALVSRLALADLSPAGRLVVHGREAEGVLAALEVKDLPVGRSVALGSGRVYRLRVDQFFVVTPPGEAETAAQSIEAAGSAANAFVTVTDVTHGRTQIGLFGPEAPALLGRLCGLDFSADAFDEGEARQSSVAKTTQLLLRHDVEGPGGPVPAYSVIGARSLADYLWGTIEVAGHDLGLQPIGWRAVAQLMGWSTD